MAEITTENADVVGAVARALHASGVPASDIQSAIGIIADHVVKDSAGGWTFTDAPGSAHAGALHSGAEHDPTLFAGWLCFNHPEKFPRSAPSPAFTAVPHNSVTARMLKAKADAEVHAKEKSRQSTVGRTPATITEACTWANNGDGDAVKRFWVSVQKGRR